MQLFIKIFREIQTDNKYFFEICQEYSPNVAREECIFRFIPWEEVKKEAMTQYMHSDLDEALSGYSEDYKIMCIVYIYKMDDFKKIDWEFYKALIIEDMKLNKYPTIKDFSAFRPKDIRRIIRKQIKIFFNINKTYLNATIKKDDNAKKKILIKKIGKITKEEIGNIYNNLFQVNKSD